MIVINELKGNTMWRVLIVDDEKIERNGLTKLISKLQLPVETDDAPNGEVALEKIQDKKFDILLTDIKMPFIDGLELARRAREISPEMVVIIFTAYGDFQKAQQAIQAHVYHYILKPIDITEFKAVMEECFATLNQRNTLAKNIRELECTARLQNRQELLIRSLLGRESDSEVKGQILQVLQRNGDQANAAAISHAVAAALEIIHKEYASPLSLESIANRVYLTPSYLSALFHRQTGINIIKYLNNYRLDISVDLVKNTNKRVHDIAETVGFKGDSYFISQFKHRFGMTPAQSRGEE